MSSSSTSVHLAFLLVWTLLGLATSSTFTSSPEPFNNVVQNRLTLTCKADIPKNIISIEISKENQRAIAIINTRDGLGMGPNAQTNMEGEGHIERDATKTFLAVTIRNPTVGDAGTYVCHVFYFTPDMELKEERIKINTTFDDQDLTAMVTFLTSQLEGLKKTVHDQGVVTKTQNEKILQQQNTLNALNKKTQQQQNTLNDKIQQQQNEQNDKIQRQQNTLNALNQKIQQQQNTLNAQHDKIQNRFTQHDRQLVNNEQELAQLKNDSSTRCAFSAHYDNDDKFSDGSTLKFRHIDTNIGNAYDGASGDFTAPYDGVYVFTLVVATYNDDRVSVSIRKNKSQELAKVFAKDKDYWDQSSTSRVVSLTTGDTIQPLVDIYRGHNYLSVFRYYSTFSGFLLYPS